jgi:hypothetical protein
MVINARIKELYKSQHKMNIIRSFICKIRHRKSHLDTKDVDLMTVLKKNRMEIGFMSLLLLWVVTPCGIADRYRCRQRIWRVGEMTI